MTNNFKPGDLALIVACQMAPQLVGICVTLVEAIPPHDGSISHGGPWRNDGLTVAWIVEGENLVSRTVSGRLVSHPRALIAEILLMPLRGDLAPEQVKSLEVSA